MMTAISTNCTCPPVAYGWKRAVLSSCAQWAADGVRRGTADGKIFRSSWYRANPGAEAQMVADHPPSPAEFHIFAARSRSRDYRAVAFHGDHGPGRPRRRSVETAQHIRSLLLVLRRSRHHGESAGASRRRASHPFAMGQAIHL